MNDTITTHAARAMILLITLLAVTGVAAPVNVSAQSADAVTYYHLDGTGSVRMITNAAGQVVAEYDYLPFGELWTAPTVPETIQFAGKEHDQPTGFDYFGARHYTSSLGRFITPDPITTMAQRFSDPDQWNRYAYARNNPLRFGDWQGLYVIQCDELDKDCARNAEAFERALERLRKHQNEDVRNAALAFGAKDDRNGVTVTFKQPAGKTETGDASTGVIEPDPTGASAFRAVVPVSIRPGMRGPALEAAVGHEGTHVANAQRFVRTIKADGSFDNALNLTKYQTEFNAYLVTHTILAAGNDRFAYGTCGTGQCILGAGVKDATSVINLILSNPANGYGVTPTNPGPRQFGVFKDPGAK
jgi:RHS repeat-associated protein